MFYLHFLALPMFFFVRHDIVSQIGSVNAGPRSSFPLPLPRALSLGNEKSRPIALHRTNVGAVLDVPEAYLPLLLNTLTQLFCVAGVHRLTTRVSALTVTLVLVVRKAVSLLISVWMGRGARVDQRLMWTGAAMVLAGTIGYSVATGRAREKKKTD